MARIDYKQEIKWAQQEIYTASKHLSSAKMRLDGTQYAKSFDKIWEQLVKLNSKLVKDINKK